MSSTIFINGCFDIIHRGHIELFRYAKSLGDILIVGVDSDEKVAKDKGLGRPFNDLRSRVEVLSAIRYIDMVCTFDTGEDLSNLIKFVSPDILVVGSDWRGKIIVGGEYAKELRFFDRIDGYSSTKSIQDITGR